MILIAFENETGSMCWLTKFKITFLIVTNDSACILSLGGIVGVTMFILEHLGILTLVLFYIRYPI